MNLRRKIIALTLSILGCVSILGNAAYAAGTAKVTDAAGKTDEGKEDALVLRDGSLTVRTFETKADGGKPINGVKISAYRIAEIDDAGNYTAVSEFSDALREAGFEDLSRLDITFTDANAALRKALADYIRGDGAGIAPSAKGETANGTVTFDIPADQLGLYFVRGDMIEGYFDGSAEGQKGKLSYIPDSALVSIPSPPNKELKTTYWDYIPKIDLKYTKGGVCLSPLVLKSIKVQRGSLSGTRDFRFVMQAVDGAPLPDGGGTEGYVEVICSSDDAEVVNSSGAVTREGKAKGLGEVWYTKPGQYEYLIYEVKETDPYYTFDESSYKLYVDIEVTEDAELTGFQRYEKIEGETVTEHSGRIPIDPESRFTFKFTNTYSRTSGGGGGGGGGGGRGTPGGGSSSGGNPPSSGSGGGNPAGTEPGPAAVPGALPKTGMLWWPVPILAAAGIVLFAAGYILERRRN